MLWLLIRPQLDADVVTGDLADIGHLLDAAGATSQIISL
jgi:hypothetical protein